MKGGLFILSKLYSKYSELKNNDPNTLYLFKSGIFFIALEDDAKSLSEELKLRVTNLNEDIVKCGFPVSREEHYLRLLQAKEIPFQIIDNTYGVVENYSDYMNNDKVKSVIQKIMDINFDEITFKEAYEILRSTSNNLKEIYK